jgi:DNA-binding transcriptional MerR regulator
VHDVRTEVLTAAGWVTYDRLRLRDRVLTLNHVTGLSEWQPVLGVNTFEVVDEPMVEICGRRHRSVTTLNHRWPTLSGVKSRRGRAWDTTDNLWLKAATAGQDTQRQDYLILAAPHAGLPTEPKYSDALVELVGWYFTEGDLGVRPGRRTPKIAISQSHRVNPENVARIRRALTAMYGPVSEKLDKGGRYSTPDSVTRRAKARELRDQGLTFAAIGAMLGVSAPMAHKYVVVDAKVRDEVPRWREVVEEQGGRITRFKLNAAAAEPILEHAPGRVVTLDFVRHLTAAQLEFFIDTAVLGDGHYMGGVTPVLSQKDPRMCDAFELTLILSGRSLTRSQHTGMGAGKDGPRKKTQEMVTGSRATTFAPRGRSFTEIRYTGTMWCPTTPNGTWLARREGTFFYTG